VVSALDEERAEQPIQLPQLVLGEVRELPFVQLEERLVEGFGTPLPLVRDADLDHPAVVRRALARHEPRLLHAVDQARDVGNALQELVPDLLTGAGLRRGAQQDAEGVELGLGQSAGLEDLEGLGLEGLVGLDERQVGAVHEGGRSFLGGLHGVNCQHSVRYNNHSVESRSENLSPTPREPRSRPLQPWFERPGPPCWRPAAAPAPPMTRRSLLGILALALTLAGLARFADGWRPDNRISSWTSSGEGARVLERLDAAYGGDEFLLLRVEHGSDGAALEWADALGARLGGLEAAARVVDPLHLPGAAGADSPPADRLRAALQRPLVRELRLAGAEHLDFVVALRPGASPEARAEVAALIDAIRTESAAHGHRAIAAGHPLVSAALDHQAARVDRNFAPLLVLLAMCLLAVLQRSVPLAIATVLPAAIASVGTRAALHAAGWPSNLVLVAVGPLVFVIVLAASLHYAAAFRRGIDAHLTAPQAARAGLHEVLRASLLAALTTAVGFGVFATSDVEAVRRLGIAAAGGIALGTPLGIFCLRGLFAGLRVDRRMSKQSNLLVGLAQHAARRKPLVVVGALAIAAGAVFGVRGLRAGTNALDYFPAGDPLRDAFLELEAEHAGLSAIEVLVEGVPAAELARGTLDEQLDELDPVHTVFGPELVLRDLKHVAGSTAPLLLGTALRESGRAALTEPHGARWTVFLPTADAEVTRALAERAREIAAAAYPDARVRLGGSLLGALDMQAALLATLATSLALTALVTGLLFMLVTRKPRELATAFVVNLFPVAVVMLVNRLCYASLDASTVMVAAVVLGLAVDNTLHLVFAGQHGGKQLAFARVAEPAALGGAALALGFSSLALSGFAPTVHFGVLVASGVAAALVGDFVLLPALWLPRDPRSSD
jgi:uncharacterized protein